VVDFRRFTVDDLSFRDQFRYRIGEAVADAMQAAMLALGSGFLEKLDASGRAEALTALTLPSVRKIEEIIREFAQRKEEE
jgi:uncharacterized NAD(P)/FAD-binding protein YdhS